MISPIEYERLMKTDIEYATRHYENELDRYKAALYAVCEDFSNLLKEDTASGMYDEYLNKVVDSELCGSLYIKPEYRWWERD